MTVLNAFALALFGPFLLLAMLARKAVPTRVVADNRRR